MIPDPSVHGIEHQMIGQLAQGDARMVAFAGGYLEKALGSGKGNSNVKSAEV